MRKHVICIEQDEIIWLYQKRAYKIGPGTKSYQLQDYTISCKLATAHFSKRTGNSTTHMGSISRDICAGSQARSIGKGCRCVQSRIHPLPEPANQNRILMICCPSHFKNPRAEGENLTGW